MKRAIFAGSFDPFTLGHKDIAVRAAQLFDEVIIAVAAETGKNSRSLSERKKIITVSLDGIANVAVDSFDGLLTDFMKQSGVNILVRGVRNAVDYDYEKSLMEVYRSLFKQVEFVLLPSKPELNHVSSTVVRELVRLNASINGYVDTKAEEFISKLYRE